MRQKFVSQSFKLWLLSFVLLASCGQNEKGGDFNNGPMEVPISTITKSNVELKKEYAASLEGISNVEIRPQVSGYLTKIYVEEGAYVRQGQVLFKIEDRIYQEQLRNAQAVLMSAQANLVNVKIDLDRKKELVKSNIVSDLQVKEAEAAYQAALGTVGQAKSAIESARINVDFSTIKAPLNGFVGRFNYRLGSLLAPTNPEAITVLSDNRQIFAYFSMGENEFIRFQRQYAGDTMDEKLKKVDDVALKLSDGEGYEHTGRIDAVEGQFNKGTGAITLRARFDNPKAFLRSGNTGKIILKEQLTDAVLVPIASTKSIQEKLFVFVVDKEGKAQQTPITAVGKVGQDFIVSDGVEVGDKYVVRGFDRLQSGTAVVAKSEKGQEQK
ncbi:MAG: efflux RND transporter periplasmic adaptor subunit [Sphingobacterium sp.]|jgi:membrane fusion protein (multidrug efflux system)|nr:efflux RND transporter periplasmic adaptor subunit [Sphingobacterium sp.]